MSENENESENSNTFNIDESGQINVEENHFFFDKDTKIIKQNQPIKVVSGSFEEEKKTLLQTYKPKFYSLTINTGRIAGEAGKGAFQLFKNGLRWTYSKIRNTLIPTTISAMGQLSKLLSDKLNSRRGIMSEEQEKLNEYIAFPIDIKDEEFLMSQNIVIPSQSFEILYDETITNNMSNKLSIQSKKIIHKVPNCLIFDLQGKNSIQYDMFDMLDILDGIQKKQKQKCQSGSFILFKVLAKRTSTIQLEKKQIQEQEVHELKKQEIKGKIVDNTRNIKVQIQRPIYNVQQQSWEEDKKLKAMFS